MDCFTNIVVLSQNVHKSRKTVKNLLKQYANAADIIFIQEAIFPLIRKTISTTSEEGDDVVGPPIHAAWQAIHCFERHPKTQVCSYVNWWLLSRFQLCPSTRPSTQSPTYCSSLSPAVLAVTPPPSAMSTTLPGLPTSQLKLSSASCPASGTSNSWSATSTSSRLSGTLLTPERMSLPLTSWPPAPSKT